MRRLSFVDFRPVAIIAEPHIRAAFRFKAMNAQITQLLTTLVLDIPVFIVCLAGVVLGILHRDRLGSATPLAVIGFSVLLLIRLIFPIIFYVVAPEIVRSTGGGSSQVIYGVIRFIQSLLQAVALAMIVAAIFSNRPAPTKPELPR
jgi:hypothetical protein